MKKFFVFVAPTQVAIVKTSQEAYDVLCLWPIPYCEAFSVTEEEEAIVLARQIQAMRWAIRPELFNLAPMALPNVIPVYVTYPNPNVVTCLYANTISMPAPSPMSPVENIAVETPDNVSENQPIPVIPEISSSVPSNPMGIVAASGAWSIIHWEGYAVANDIRDVISWLETKDYVHAIWFSNPQTASMWALKCYVDIFGRFNDLGDVELQRPSRILELGEEYNNPRFEDDEIKFADSAALKTLREHGLI